MHGIVIVRIRVTLRPAFVLICYRFFFTDSRDRLDKRARAAPEKTEVIGRILKSAHTVQSLRQFGRHLFEPMHTRIHRRQSAPSVGLQAGQSPPPPPPQRRQVVQPSDRHGQLQELRGDIGQSRAAEPRTSGAHVGIGAVRENVPAERGARPAASAPCTEEAQVRERGAFDQGGAASREARSGGQRRSR